MAQYPDAESTTNIVTDGQTITKTHWTINDMTPAVVATLGALNDDTLSTIFNLATESKEIFGELVLYMTLNWESTGCDWLNDMGGLVENGWQYASTGGTSRVIKDSYSVFDDISQTFDPLFVSHWDFSEMSRGLFKELQYLLYTKKDYKMARLKYNLWKINGIEWDHVFVENLGFSSDDDMQVAMVSSLTKLYSKHKVLEDAKEDCQLSSPVDLINHIYIRGLPDMASLWHPISQSFADTAITLRFGAKTCSQFTESRCIGGGFGFSVDGLGNAALFQFLGGNLAVDNAADINSEVMSTFDVAIGVYENIDALVGTVTTYHMLDQDTTAVYSFVSEKVIGAEFTYSLDLNTEQFIRSTEDNLGTFDVEEVARLTSPRIAALSVNANYDEMMKDIDYPRRAPDENDHDTKKRTKNDDRRRQRKSDVAENHKNNEIVRQYEAEDNYLAKSKINVKKHHEYLWIIVSIVGVSIVASAVCYVVKEYRENNRKTMDAYVVNYNSDEYQSLL
eukprot:65562_1